MLVLQKTFFMYFWLICINFVMYYNKVLNEIVAIPFIFISVD